MFGVGPAELLVIALAITILFGPQALPDIAKAIGKFMRQVKKELDDIQKG